MAAILAILKLFFTFFKIGLFTFGGGYAMIPLINQEMIAGGYFTLEELNYLIGISEATPGPFAVNMAGLVGFYSFADQPFLIQLTGSIFATIGVVLPSFIIILLFSIFSYKIIHTKPYKNAFEIMQPMVLGFIFAAFLSITTKVIFGDFFKNIQFDFIAAMIFFIVLSVALSFKKMSPIILVAISAILGIVFYSLV